MVGYLHVPTGLGRGTGAHGGSRLWDIAYSALQVERIPFTVSNCMGACLCESDSERERERLIKIAFSVARFCIPCVGPRPAEGTGVVQNGRSWTDTVTHREGGKFPIERSIARHHRLVYQQRILANYALL